MLRELLPGINVFWKTAGNMKIYKNLNQCVLLLAVLVMHGAISGCATTAATDPRDPWENMNRSTQNFNDTMDEYVLEPAARGYNWIMPSFMNTGVSNFFSNIRDIKVTINDFLQFKLKQGAMDATRFVVNTTVGIAGFIDVGTMIGLPKHNEDFGQTLGYWGVPSGPYLVLPFWGPSTVRGTTGRVGDAAMNPLTYLFLFSDSAAASLASFGAYAIDVVDRRAAVLGFDKVAEEAALDRYEFFRDSYLQRREHLINDDEDPELENDLEEDFDFDESEVSEPEAEIESNQGN